MKPTSSGILLVTSLLAIEIPAAAASWPADGLLVSDSASHFNNHIPVLAKGEQGGVFIAWQWSGFPVGLQINDPRLQRFTSTGQIASGWPTEGVRLTAAARNQAPRFICPDNLGGAYVVWGDIRNLSTTNIDIYAQHVTADGTVDPAWPPDGLPISVLPLEQDLLSAFADGAGGFFVSWSDRSPADGADVMGIRIRPDGSPAPGWPVGGKPIAPTSPFAQANGLIVGDGNGGIFTLYGMFEPDINMYVRHLDGRGEIVPGWPAGDAPITRAPNDQGGYMIPDGAGGLYVVWQDDRSRGSAPYSEQYLDVYAQHMLADGTIAPGWPADGLPVCVRPGIQKYPDLVSDGAGGVYIVWEEWTGGWDLNGVRLHSDGTLAAGWAENGTPVMSGPESHETFRLSQDGLGGFYVVAEGASSGQIWVQHMQPDGQPELGWPVQGTRVTPNFSGQEWPAIAWDGYAGAYVAWDDARYGSTNVFLKHYGDGPTAVTVSLVSAEAEPGIARLAWQVSGGSSSSFTLERRSQDSMWATMATLSPNGSGRLSCEDRALQPGRYAYRLSYVDEGTMRRTPETWVDVPSTHTLSLAGFTPNPTSSSNLSASFTVPKQAPGTLALFDVTGREIAREDLTSLGAGRHTLRMGGDKLIAAGVYWLKLAHDGRALTTRGVVIR